MGRFNYSDDVMEGARAAMIMSRKIAQFSRYQDLMWKGGVEKGIGSYKATWERSSRAYQNI